MKTRKSVDRGASAQGVHTLRHSAVLPPAVDRRRGAASVVTERGTEDNEAFEWSAPEDPAALLVRSALVVRREQVLADVQLSLNKHAISIHDDLAPHEQLNGRANKRREPAPEALHRRECLPVRRNREEEVQSLPRSAGQAAVPVLRWKLFCYKYEAIIAQG